MSRLKQGTGLALSAIVAAGVIPSLGAAGAGAAPPAKATEVQAPVPDITWKSCGDDLPGECATALAPLDYDNPYGPAILLDLRKVPAKQQSRKLGSLFVNPGGPGGSSTGFAPWAAQLLGPTVAARYDVIGVDPRGVGEHSQMVCKNANPVPPFPMTPYPETVAQSKIAFRSAEYARSACTRNPSPIVRHMSTADTARDMDLIRQAVGDPQLNYYGISYGTQLGSTYASMFPSRVGRFAVDAVLDPVAWSTGGPSNLPATQPFSTRLRSAKGASEALLAALKECDRVGRSHCDLAPGASAKWAKMSAAAKAGTLTAGGEPLPYSVLIGGVLGYLYGQSYDGLDTTLQMIYDENFGTRARAGASALATLRAKADRVREAPYTSPLGQVQIISDAFMGVGCADTRNPETREAWWNAGRAQDKLWPGFGSLWTWATPACAKYPISTKADTWFGPYGGATANPILVVGNTYDPATPYHGAQAVAGMFRGARLLTYNGWGHGALGNSCATAAFDRLYATGALPARGAVCQLDRPLWG
ncbi:alpha/beta hydrolase [Nostocoides veronense]|uniref:Alpha/beta hydrolase n=1 Tax=Nostocoides veronense TaxID=330836 RepID=A0ABN2LKJ1_9MICO